MVPPCLGPSRETLAGWRVEAYRRPDYAPTFGVGRNEQVPGKRSLSSLIFLAGGRRGGESRIGTEAGKFRFPVSKSDPSHVAACELRGSYAYASDSCKISVCLGLSLMETTR
jgi:hypothetical protein